jgi:uncharacterized LabA/DUF88 family protein
MGVRSDLTKELKTLLNSDIIRGKVTVQRAYADWRRYPQYVMPLTERSIDMIWATAVGSTKKNATDIRLAIDAVELVFTRPEIGTFIILSGDSDFSSLVLKLKEYGKYVIGIGIRESASDLLIQNCDEYYSYSELAGLNKETDAPSVQRDPWELVREATARMIQQGDVMRSDRLKQVMQQLDANFDERNAGFNRFSKFVAEAANRGLISLTKLDNGQFEVGPIAAALPKGPPLTEVLRPEENGRRTRGRRGPGGGLSERGPSRRGRDDRERDRGAAPAPAERRDDRPPGGPLTLSGAFDLLRRALGELATPARHDVVRARMAALHGREDPLLHPSRFPRLLRQANDAEIADVKKTADDEYELSLSRVERARITPNGSPVVPVLPLGSPIAETPSGDGPPTTESLVRTATLRFRRGSRGPLLSSAVPMVGLVEIERPAQPAPASAPLATKPARSRNRRGAGPVKAESEPELGESAGSDAPAADARPTGPARRPRSRRGRGRATPRKAPAS